MWLNVQHTYTKNSLYGFAGSMPFIFSAYNRQYTEEYAMTPAYAIHRNNQSYQAFQHVFIERRQDVYEILINTHARRDSDLPKC